MKYKFFVSSFAFALIVASSFVNAASTPANPPKVDPLRFAKGRVQALKRTLLFNPATGKTDLKVEVVCDKNVDVPVYDFSPSNSYSWEPTEVPCNTEMNGKPVSLSLSAYLSYKTLTLFKGGAEEKFKGLSTNSWFSGNSGGLPEIPFQDSYTKELDRQNFVTVSRPQQYVICEVEEGQDSNGPVKDPSKKSCNTVNPVMIEVTWDVQDTE